MNKYTVEQGEDMKSGGVGGSNTQTGLRFESKTDLAESIKKQSGYNIEDSKLKKGKSKFYDLYFDSKLVGSIIQKHSLYRFLEKEKLEWKNHISKQILPDDSVYVLKNKTIYIIEKKFQGVGGSVDEKLQTCDFKKKQYEKIFSLLDIKVEYIYLLDEWFRNPKYEDTLNYIKSVGCDYYFDEIPFKRFGLPSSNK